MLGAEAVRTLGGNGTASEEGRETAATIARAGAIASGGMHPRAARAAHPGILMTGTPFAPASAPLQFANSEGCRQWLEQLTLTNVQLTQHVLTAQLASLSAAQL